MYSYFTLTLSFIITIAKHIPHSTKAKACLALAAYFIGITPTRYKYFPPLKFPAKDLDVLSAAAQKETDMDALSLNRSPIYCLKSILS